MKLIFSVEELEDLEQGAYNEGFDDGLRIGRGDGYDEGYDQGYREATAIFAGRAEQPVTKEDLAFATDEIPQIEAGC